ncbi:YtxH domain-containing protein [Yinghuangia sp. ASG 101]|uniref:YtxH domain-containing protein n=1 Tax=Yinghuangia sp. ASG 101 TaxID=2896848 RepID=UPI001E2E282F|nr:YtxH domain-containing protein [Yinghuangia sp. ASG 101]UGQ14105.1 YtxH domain-containing protein [Yinghuangia sp. ASG 101]
MGTRITFVAGLAVGYVLGAKAGRDRYEQIRKATREFVDSAPVQNAGQAAADFGRERGGKAVQKLGEHLPERVGRHLPERFGGQSANGDRAHDARSAAQRRYDDGL